jgi:ABC-type oligopeptide transport system substrate-binding subunit
VMAALPTNKEIVPGRTYDFFTWWLAAGIFSGLMRIERGLNVVPDATADLGVSSDGLRYTARLRRDAVWSDGNAVSSTSRSPWGASCRKTQPSSGRPG